MPETPEMLLRDAVNAMRQLVLTHGWQRVTEEIAKRRLDELRALLTPRTLPTEEARQEHSYHKGMMAAFDEVLDMPRKLEVEAARGD
jgi:hypothetical protein